METVNKYIFDACGLITFLRNELGAEKVIQLFSDDNNTFFMHAINLGEVYYDTSRINRQKADELFSTIEKLGIQIIWIIDKSLITNAGRYKINYKMSYADTFVLASAKELGSKIITTDHHEFDIVSHDSDLDFYWLR